MYSHLGYTPKPSIEFQQKIIIQIFHPTLVSRDKPSAIYEQGCHTCILCYNIHIYEQSSPYIPNNLARTNMQLRVKIIHS